MSFNGAATFQSRKCARQKHDVDGLVVRFNGAATFSRGNSSYPSPLGRSVTAWLQWGRDFSVAEIRNASASS